MSGARLWCQWLLINQGKTLRWAKMKKSGDNGFACFSQKQRKDKNDQITLWLAFIWQFLPAPVMITKHTSNLINATQFLHLHFQFFLNIGASGFFLFCLCLRLVDQCLCLSFMSDWLEKKDKNATKRSVIRAIVGDPEEWVILSH